jgi:hypothetical protein
MQMLLPQVSSSMKVHIYMLLLQEGAPKICGKLFARKQAEIKELVINTHAIMASSISFI